MVPLKHVNWFTATIYGEKYITNDLNHDFFGKFSVNGGYLSNPSQAVC